MPEMPMNWVLPGRRKRGRPRKSRGDGMRDAICAKGLTAQQCENREVWRKSLGLGRRQQTL